MPLTLTSRDKAYVRAVAHGGAHNMYKGIRNVYTSGSDAGKFYLGTAHARYIMLHLGVKPKSQIAKSWHTGNNFGGQDIDHTLSAHYKNSHDLQAFNFPKAVDVLNADGAVTTKQFQHRYGDNVFLESTNLKLRVYLPHGRYIGENGAHPQNCLCRMIVFRAKEKQNHIPEESIDHANPHYDLFLDDQAYPAGLNGYVDHQDEEHYKDLESHNGYHALAMQNMLVNKKKYVVMKDCKFNLGQDFGSLAFETNLRWDWRDQMNEIPASRQDITAAQGGDGPNKNYEWYILVLGMNPHGETATQDLATEVLGTTHAKTLD